MTDRVSYKGGYKYQLHRRHQLRDPTDLWCGLLAKRSAYLGQYIWLGVDGLLQIAPGYCWDGPSGPVIDRPSTMRAALVHDALYQLIRNGVVAQAWRPQADELFRRICVEDGVWPWLARVYCVGLGRFGASAASSRNVKRVMIAP